jgi:hypothetical protein
LLHRYILRSQSQKYTFYNHMAYYLRLSDDEAIEFIKLKNDQILQIYIMLLFLKRAEINLFTKKVSPQRNLKHIAPMS